MIRPQDVLPTVLEAAPAVAACLPVDDDEERLPYVDAADVAAYLVDCARRGRAAEVEALLGVIEQLLVDGTADVRELAAIGYLESAQGAVERGELPEAALVARLRPRPGATWPGVGGVVTKTRQQALLTEQTPRSAP